MLRYKLMNKDDPRNVVFYVNEIEIIAERKFLESIPYFEVILSNRFPKSDRIDITIDFLPRDTNMQNLINDIFFYGWANKRYHTKQNVHYLDCFPIYYVCNYFDISDKWMNIDFKPFKSNIDLSQTEKEIIVYYMQNINRIISQYTHRFNLSKRMSIQETREGVMHRKVLDMLFPGIIIRRDMFLSKLEEYKDYLGDRKISWIVDNDILFWIFKGSSILTDMPITVHLNDISDIFIQIIQNREACNNIETIIYDKISISIILRNGFKISYSRMDGNVKKPFKRTVIYNLEKLDNITVTREYLQNLITMIIPTNEFIFGPNIIEKLRKHIDKGFTLINNNEVITRETLDSIERYMELYEQNDHHNISKRDQLIELLIQHNIDLQGLPSEDKDPNMVYYLPVIEEDYIDIAITEIHDLVYRAMLNDSITVIVDDKIRRIFDIYGIKYDTSTKIINNDMNNITYSIDASSNIFSDVVIMRMTFTMEISVFGTTEDPNIYIVYIINNPVIFERINDEL